MRRVVISAAGVIWLGTIATVVGRDPQQPPTSSTPDGWTIPANAADEKNPLTVTDAVVAAGRKLFVSKCQRCHGPQGKGNGPDAEKKHRMHMDLTRGGPDAARNPDGVVFHKIWNGRTSPKMPRFAEELSKEQVWAIVAYVQTLRAKS